MEQIEITGKIWQDSAQGGFFKMDIVHEGKKKKAAMFEDADVAFYDKNGNGQYQADVSSDKKTSNGRTFTNWYVKNLSRPAGMVATPSPSPSSQGQQAQRSSEFRSPDQFAREAAVRGAIDISTPLILAHANKGMEPEELEAKALGLYSDWFDVILEDLIAKPAVQSAPQPAPSAAQPPSGSGPRKPTANGQQADPDANQAVYNRFRELAMKGWGGENVTESQAIAAANSWTNSEFGMAPFVSLNPEARREAVAVIEKAMGA